MEQSTPKRIQAERKEARSEGEWELPSCYATEERITARFEALRCRTSAASRRPKRRFFGHLSRLFWAL